MGTPAVKPERDKKAEARAERKADAKREAKYEKASRKERSLSALKRLDDRRDRGDRRR